MNDVTKNNGGKIVKYILFKIAVIIGVIILFVIPAMEIAMILFKNNKTWFDIIIFFLLSGLFSFSTTKLIKSVEETTGKKSLKIGFKFYLIMISLLHIYMYLTN